MANNSDYYRAQLEAQARGREHAQHIEEYARMCQMMIEESVPILIGTVNSYAQILSQASMKSVVRQ